MSLYGNQITSIPDTALANMQLGFLMLSGNPLQKLPATLGGTARFYQVQVQDTNVTDVPVTWPKMSLASWFVLNAFRTPLCGDSVSSGGVLATINWRVQCVEQVVLYNGILSHSYYPLEGKTMERTLELLQMT
ncbi:TPA: hypothetical protein N0F65_004336 [Lagenidium giganteum]|uniref:Uncharacterized protein n=1 Tax=Lagenidium giganteum TaxID=4803 RepID=A0AAV2YKC2_9STRA|nr:TPA: hypothetical protein N0F65_004336 [Lagenidium giganteum]